MLIKPENTAKLGMHKKLDVWMLLSTLVLVPPEARGNSKPFWNSFAEVDVHVEDVWPWTCAWSLHTHTCVPNAINGTSPMCEIGGAGVCHSLWSYVMVRKTPGLCWMVWSCCHCLWWGWIRQLPSEPCASSGTNHPSGHTLQSCSQTIITC